MNKYLIPSFNKLSLSILNRLDEIRKYNHLNKSQFEKSLGKSNGYLNTLKKNESIPGTDVMLKILDNYPNIDLNWLLTGEGNMKKGGHSQESVANEKQDEYKVSSEEAVSIRQDIRAVNENLLALNEGMKINMERLAKGIDRGLKNDLKVIQFIEKINVDDITRTTNSLKKLIEK